jgi:RNA polymerase sigma-70 factor, ECF subfamily
LGNRLLNITNLYKAREKSALLGTPDRFSAFYEQSRLPVFRYLYGLTGGPQEDVEDLTAEAFLRAWRARRSFQGDEQAALGWLMKIGRRLVIDDYRRRKVRPVAEDSIPTELPQDEPLPEEVAMAGEDQRVLWRLLRAIPDEPREILVLRYLLGWHVNQIAIYIEVPENTVSVTIRRTLDWLRQHWPAQEK